MAILGVFSQRESVRAYAPRSVSREVLDRCLEAARLSPSACNSQPWSFVVADTPEVTRAIVTQALSGIYAMNSFARTSPVIVAVLKKKSGFFAFLGGLFQSTQFSLVDIGLACSAFMLQATEEGLGTCLLGWFNERAVKKILGIPRHQTVSLLITVGYPLERKPREKKRKKLSEIRTFYQQRV